MKIQFEVILVLLPSLFAICAILKTIQLIKINRALLSQVNTLVGSLQKKELARQKKEKHTDTRDFKTSLDDASLNTQLAGQRLAQEHPSPLPLRSQALGEKYGFISSLAQKGLEAGEIATTLSLSTEEVNQVLRLSSLAPLKTTV